MINKIKYLSVMMVLTLSAIACIACSSGGDIGNTSSENISTDVSDESSSEIVSSQEAVSSEVSSAVSSEIMSSAMTSSKAVTSSSPSSAVSSKSTKIESKAEVSSKAPTSSQIKPKPVSSQTAKSKPTSSEMPLFGELMDEAEVDKIIAEGIEYANSKGMTWKDDYSIEGSGYYNPAFSGEGAEIFKRDLFYNIDQIYHLNVDDPDYDAEKYGGCTGYYKIVKGEFEEPGYWYGFVLY